MHTAILLAALLSAAPTGPTQPPTQQKPTEPDTREGFQSLKWGMSPEEVDQALMDADGRVYSDDSDAFKSVVGAARGGNSASRLTGEFPLDAPSGPGRIFVGRRPYKALVTFLDDQLVGIRMYEEQHARTEAEGAELAERFGDWVKVATEKYGKGRKTDQGSHCPKMNPMVCVATGRLTVGQAWQTSQSEIEFSASPNEGPGHLMLQLSYRSRQLWPQYDARLKAEEKAKKEAQRKLGKGDL